MIIYFNVNCCTLYHKRKTREKSCVLRRANSVVCFKDAQPLYAHFERMFNSFFRIICDNNQANELAFERGGKSEEESESGQNEERKRAK